MAPEPEPGRFGKELEGPKDPLPERPLLGPELPLRSLCCGGPNSRDEDVLVEPGDTVRYTCAVLIFEAEALSSSTASLIR